MHTGTERTPQDRPHTSERAKDTQKTGVTEQVSRISWDKDTIESGEREEQGLRSCLWKAWLQLGSNNTP